MAIINFNASQVAPAGDFEPIPNNWYNVTITDSEIKATKDGQGSFLALTLKVMDGDFANRLVFCRLNIVNKNPVAVEIAFGQLSSICHAINVIDVGDTNELHGKPFQVKVVVRPPKGEYEASNECKAFKAVDGGAPAGPSSAGKKAAPAWADKSKEVDEDDDDDDEEAEAAAALAEAKAKKAKAKKAAAKKKAEEEAALAAEDDDDDDDAELAAAMAAVKAKKAKKAKAKKAAEKKAAEEAEEEVDPADAVVEEVEDGDADGEEKPPWLTK